MAPLYLLPPPFYKMNVYALYATQPCKQAIYRASTTSSSPLLRTELSKVSALSLSNVLQAFSASLYSPIRTPQLLLPVNISSSSTIFPHLSSNWNKTCVTSRLPAQHKSHFRLSHNSKH